MTEARDKDATAEPTLGPPEPTCIRCGYKLKGTASSVCPECGMAKTVRVEFTSGEQYDRACRALVDAGLLLRRREPRADPPGLALGLGAWPGAVWIDKSRQREARNAMIEAGVYELGSHQPIVDRSEPQCPRCGEALDPEGPSVCAACGSPFDWVSIEEPQIDTTGLLCRECGYDLTGIDEARCPECGSELPADLLVEAAAGEARGDRPRRWAFAALLAGSVGLVLAILLLPVIAAMSLWRGPTTVVVLGLATASIFLLIYAWAHSNAGAGRPRS